MKIISLVCSRLQLSSLLFVTSLYYFFEVFIVSLTVCCLKALFSAVAVSNSRFPMFLTSLFCSRLRLFHILFVTSLFYLLRASIVSLSVCYVTALFSASAVSSSVCYVTIISFKGFHCFIICSYVIALFSA